MILEAQLLYPSNSLIVEFMKNLTLKRLIPTLQIVKRILFLECILEFKAPNIFQLVPILDFFQSLTI